HTIDNLYGNFAFSFARELPLHSVTITGRTDSRSTASPSTMAWRDLRGWLLVLLWATASVEAADVASPDGFAFEDGKTLLFTIRSNIGEDPQKAFVTRGNGNRPAPSPNEPLPAVYRSDLLDELPDTVRRLDKTYMVAEMRVDRAVVMRVVFDVGDYPDSLDQFNWFSPSRLIGAWPYRLDDVAKFSAFSIEGDANKERRFFIATSFDGCNGDRGFWLVSGARDPCGWGHNGWKGLAPALIYNRFKDRTLQQGAAYADQFLVYLTDTVDEFRAEFRKPFFHAERKQLLYTIKANIHKSALETFRQQQNYRAPIDDDLPILYRSDLLDDLSRTVKDSGMTQMVMELVKDHSVVAQLVFNVTKDVDSLTLDNWFSLERLESSYPYLVDKTKFNYFSLDGDVGEQRRFYISYNYGGCHVDAGFIAISDARDSCNWANRNWRGSPPLLLYNRLQNKPFHAGVDTAERMLVYLTHEVEDRRWKFRQPFIVDGDKQILYTITPNVGKEAVDTFKHQQDYPIPSDRSLPPIYRSDLLDQMDKTVRRSGRSKMVAEMRKNNAVVARLVFDVATDTDSLTLLNWFSRDRLVAAYPYQISKKIHLNYFSVDGDTSIKRGFSVTDTGKGCDNDLGFWIVTDRKDPCNWGSQGWKGAAPVLLYNRFRTAPFRTGVDYADRFVVYLTNHVDE
uniref:DUF4091 domain-containing protein n=1 Tax=Macrostomum lignano TaxID=282301 RepID=A0A1I8G1E0_9PLAT